MPKDEAPLGYDQHLDNLPAADDLSPRQKRIATALAMIRDGSSIKGAAEAVGIPRSTLYGYKQGWVDLTASDTGKGLQQAEGRIVEASLAIANAAADRVLDRIEEGDMRDADLLKAYGIATDKVALKRQWARQRDAGTGGDAMTALARLLEGKKTTVTVEDDPTSQAIDVTVTEPEQ